MFTPQIPFGEFLFIRLFISIIPSFGKPNLLIRALSSSNLKTLGLLFPYCDSGVTVPISEKPKPSLPISL
tara:strand:+ start:4341 stop:4550 length:210 start_codon:yes stop_codon:yes gene_type:complete